MADQPNPQPTGRGWSNPQIIIAIIGAISTIVVTFIGILPNIIASMQPPTPTPIIVTATPPPTATQPLATFTTTPQSIAVTVTLLPSFAGDATPTTIASTADNTSSDAANETPNVRLMYDAVSFTLLNESGRRLSLEGISFRSEAGTWEARGWGPSIYTSLPAGQCLRLRDRSAGQRQPPAPCVNKIYGLIEVGTVALFWRNTESFDVLHGSDVIATCTVASGECSVTIQVGA